MASASEEVLWAARQRAEALADGDVDRLRTLLHPAFGWVSHRGARFDRDGYVAANVGGPTRWHAQELRRPEVEVVGDTAVLRCLAVDTVDVGTGTPERFAMPMTQTWVRSDGRWRLLAGHAGPRIPEEQLPGPPSAG